MLKLRSGLTRSGESALERQSGFTLLELMVVLGLMVLLLSLVLPGLRHSITRQQDRANLRQLTAALRLARSQAATGQQRVRLFVNRDTGRYWLEGTNRQGALTGMRVTDAALVWQDRTHRQGYIAFYGDGSSSGGKLNLEDSAHRHFVLEVEIITGRVILKTGNET